ncbi:peroxisomal membrane protein Pex25p [[Candida] jaroonii]|uniref:Peroxisomal membrane protein Pex25p n=1 Tax=[Candida] jaroonii TaxID=467808 RepID=A0ACA9Y5Y8_9ASCO|nr:peroxisomal membrane protein Pex25p [[Candida] jaroonii]
MTDYSITIDSIPVIPLRDSLPRLHTPLTNNLHSIHSVTPNKYHSIDKQIYPTHSQWIDSPINSPSPVKMSVTVTEESKVEPKFETPVRSKFQSYITPITDGKNKFDEKIDLVKEQKPKDIKEVKEIANVSSIDILFAMINNLTGKDKLAKVGQYLLRLLLYHANQTKEYLSDDSINIDIINGRYNDRTKKLNLLRNFIKHPFDFAKIVVILFCSRFNDRFKGMVNGLSTYRQFLRFGKTPFRIRDLYHKMQKVQKSGNFNELLTRKFLGELIGFYYGINDECLLMFKLGILTNKSVRKVVGRHESLAWYYDSILGIYNAVDNINKLSQKEMDLNIQIQVKNKARSLSKQILGHRNESNNILINYYNENSSNGDSKELEEIKFKKMNAYLDLYKWISDFIFDSYTVFNWRLPFDTFQIWFGISAASLSTYKIYRETRRKMIGGK